MSKPRTVFFISVLITATCTLLLITVGTPTKRVVVAGTGRGEDPREEAVMIDTALRPSPVPQCLSKDRENTRTKGPSLRCDCTRNGASANGTPPWVAADIDAEHADPSRAATSPTRGNQPPHVTAPTGMSKERLGTNLIILASMRTGSSFVGEIFNRHDDVFYLFEPGFAFHTEMESRKAAFIEPLFVDVLGSLYRCNVTNHQFYLKWLAEEDRNGVGKKAPKLYRVCPNFRSQDKLATCGRVPADDFNRECRKRKHMAVKSIRVWDVGTLLPLIQASDLRLQVVHLVRDPRGMIASRVIAMNPKEHNKNTLNMTDGMIEYLMDFCLHSITSKESGYYLPAYKDSYFLLRYEDMSLDPIGTAQRIYNFTKLGALPDKIKKWLVKNTATSRRGLYTTSRVSREAYQSWRTRLDFETVKAVERVGHCAEMMEHFGYLPVQDGVHLKNLSSSLVVQVPPPVDFDKYQI